ncbi:hypothetical protein [Leisingera methylohalidivorans]|uniref:hypothetical protein n=1 Tax=Leisingera methylohalidivorans TaxID=133924 RepID=UPI0005C6856D|nr:hypothetical protein [Leisingera methylohalidivorans]
MIEISGNRIQAIATGHLTPKPGLAWELTGGDIEAIKECIELSVGREKTYLKQIPLLYQALMSRWADQSPEDLYSMRSLPIGGMWRVQFLFYSIEDWLVLKVLCEALMDYARGGKLTATFEDLDENILKGMGWINNGSSKFSGGILLISNPQFKEFVDSREGVRIVRPEKPVWT